VVEKKFKDIYENNSNILKNYGEAIDVLKKYELHKAFKKEGKNNLSDIYYDEN
jgi:hypothetical protein